MNAKALLSLFAICLLLTGCGGKPGQSSEDDSSATSNSGNGDEQSSAGPSEDEDSGSSGGDSSGGAITEDAALVAIAEQLGMTVDELNMKKQMLLDMGITEEEIAKLIQMGGDPTSIFKDDPDSNTNPPDNINELVFFQNNADEAIKLSDRIGSANLVLVFTRGYSGGMICPFCTTQVAQLAANKQEFVDRDAEVLVIYPGSSEHLPDFAAAVMSVDREKADIAAVKWPVLLDPDLQAVKLLNIAADLALPSTFIIDKQGNVVFAYVGANRTDRPSAKALLAQLDALQ